MNKEIGYRYHQCDKSTRNDLEIVHTDFNEEIGRKQWWFHLYKEASEEDLELGEADQVGEILFSKRIVISFCPFCGEKLE